MYEFFYDLAKYLNENWEGNYTQKEIACNAYTYLCDCQASTTDSLKGSMIVVKEKLEEDVDSGSEEADFYLWMLNYYLKRKGISVCKL